MGKWIKRILAAVVISSVHFTESDPNKLIEAVPDRDYDAGFDPGEVADFALGMLGNLPSMRGFYTAAPRGLAASYTGGAYRATGSGYRAPPTRPSTITGGSR